MAAAKPTLAWDFSFPAIDGGTLDFRTFTGGVLLVVNTASFCGYTYQYEGLRKLYDAKAAEGLTVIGVPSRDFNQESPDNKTVKAFCETKYGIDFPLSGVRTSKVRLPRHSMPGCDPRLPGNPIGISTRC